MVIPGFMDYERRAYCKDVRCPVQVLLDKTAQNTADYEEIRAICSSRCIHTTYDFHHWLIKHGYHVVKPAPES